MKNNLYIILAFSLFSCAALEEPQSSLVVEAYIYENKPVENIKVTLVNPINSELAEMPVSGAEVRIVSNNIGYQLTESNVPGFYNLENNLVIENGSTYMLSVKYEDIEMEGQTTIPPKVGSLSSNKDTLLLNEPDQFLRINWENENELWFLGVISANNADRSEFPFNGFFSVPTQETNLKITPNDVQNEGKQDFILYGITKEYESLYRISTSAIGSSNAGNMTNGFGIFAGFSSDTLSFVAIQK